MVLNDVFLHLLDSRSVDGREGVCVAETVEKLEATAAHAESIGADASAVLARGFIGRVWVEAGEREPGLARLHRCIELARSRDLATTAEQLRRLLG